MSKILFPSGSLTGDPIGSKRFIEVDEGNMTTAATSNVIVDHCKSFGYGTPVEILRGL
jgi:hypothetical protein